ncbi:hypothetical protein SAMN04487993_1008155 [Salipiger marinus]|uniref:HdeA/HdeB family protein n=2 Tax=Salipiger marinus TaxID=555512 RepID=A0A1G8MMQ4_9RHOB|nr:hypothetical protein SAMN04487993_1008155 [Salipiger marinus]
MRALMMGLIGLGLTSGMAAAQGMDPANCAQSAKVVMEAVQARKDGIPQARTERELRRVLDRNAGQQLAEWIYSLPADELTPEVGRSWKAQCEGQ